MSDALRLGPLLLPTTLLVVLAAILVALAIGRRMDRDPGKPAETTLLSAVLFGALVARGFFVLEYRELYFAAPLSMLDIRDGGWSAPAGLVAFLLYGTARMRDRPEQARALRWAMGGGGAVFLIGLGALAVRPVTDTPLPDLALHTLDGRPVALRSFVGQPVVLNLWATRCPPCVREMPVLAKAQRERPDIHIVLVNQGEKPAQVAAWLQGRQLEMRNVLVDEVRQAGAALKQQGYPTTMFFDAQGRLVSTRVGEVSEATLAERLAALKR